MNKKYVNKFFNSVRGESCSVSKKLNICNHSLLESLKHSIIFVISSSNDKWRQTHWKFLWKLPSKYVAKYKIWFYCIFLIAILNTDLWTWMENLLDRIPVLLKGSHFEALSLVQIVKVDPCELNQTL